MEKIITIIDEVPKTINSYSLFVLDIESSKTKSFIELIRRKISEIAMLTRKSSLLCYSYHKNKLMECLSFKKGFYFIDKINDYIYIVKPTRDEKSKGPFFVENLQNLSELINDNIVIE